VRAGLYQRVSDDQDGRSRSVEQQNAAGQLAAQRYGWDVVHVYNEPGISASRYARRTRPEWARLMADIKARQLDVIIMWEPSRGSRELEAWAAFLNACRKSGCRIYITDHDKLYNVSKARDWRSLAEDGVDSGYESEKISSRSRRGVADAAERGQPHGRLPYGYMRTYEHVSGRKPVIYQVPNPDTAPTAQEIITRIAGGDAVSALVSDLARRGISSPTGQPRWARASIARLVLEGVVYIGKRRHNGGPLLDGDWPAIVDPETYWKAVNILSDPRRLAAANGRGGIRPGAAKWLLSYIATCAKCGAPLSVQKRPRGGKMEPHYRCSSSAGGCAIIPVEFMDKCITAALIRWICIKPGVYEGITRTDDSEARAARDEADAERARLAGFERKAIAGLISDESFARIAGGIEARIAELTDRAEQSAVPTALRELLSSAGERSELEEREHVISTLWDKMSVSARRHVIMGVVKEMTLLPATSHSAALDPARIHLRFRDV
jgi:site-specific DNA recombinase